MINKKLFKLFDITLLTFSIIVPNQVMAHRSGCHNIHTCSSDSNSYICGDLGYPCDGSTTLKSIPTSKINVPLVIEKTFNDTFGRKPTETESTYWKNRFRHDKNGIYKIRRTMDWHKSIGSFGPKVTITQELKDYLTSNINSIFRSVYDRDPTTSENAYWRSRVNEKPSYQSLQGAMVYHKLNNIQH